jgi:HSP20 family molecular chaperone IbpA
MSEDGADRFRELRYGSFRRTFRLPSTVDADAVSASYDAGIVTILVTGAYAASQARRIEIPGARAAEAEAGPECGQQAA